jgi:hypothetical protein
LWALALSGFAGGLCLDAFAGAAALLSPPRGDGPEERLIDEAIEESFPASDPPALSYLQ